MLRQSGGYGLPLICNEWDSSGCAVDVGVIQKVPYVAIETSSLCLACKFMYSQIVTVVPCIQLQPWTTILLLSPSIFYYLPVSSVYYGIFEEQSLRMIVEAPREIYDVESDSFSFPRILHLAI